MKLLLLYEHLIVGATWINPYPAIRIPISAYYYRYYPPGGCNHFLLLNPIGENVDVNSEHKIRFQKLHQWNRPLLTDLNLPKGLNEF